MSRGLRSGSPGAPETSTRSSCRRRTASTKLSIGCSKLCSKREAGEQPQEAMRNRRVTKVVICGRTQAGSQAWR
jgi:hypothetical protein